MTASRDDSGAKNGKNGGGARAQKRAQFTETKHGSAVPDVIVALALVAAVVVGVVFATRGGDASAPAPDAAQAAPVDGGRVTVPVAELADGTARFYSADVAGTTVEYFVVQDAGGEVRTAFNACDVCYPAKKGYTQDGDVMVCNNCGRRFSTDSIGAEVGGCNPSPLEAKVRGGEVVITADALAAGTRYFQ
jgi:uncharacterized membrane protein